MPEYAYFQKIRRYMLKKRKTVYFGHGINKDYDVQQLLKESKLFITDFSSVFFDFGYMGKSVLYYHFDRTRYVKEHYDYTKGYFDYERDGFGGVVYSRNDLVEMICTLTNNGFVHQTKFQKRIDMFFELKDCHNCDRIYENTTRILKGKLK